MNIDHFVVAANDLASGVEYVKNAFGVEVPKGGVHANMATHNHLMSLGNDMFLEIIAPNPEGEKPTRPCWFGLDDAMVKQRLNQSPALLTWVANTKDLRQLAETSTHSIGKIEKFTRGELEWFFALPSDGRLLAGGLLPYAMQWNTPAHPSRNMTDLGCTLASFEIRSAKPIWLQERLEELELADKVTVSEIPVDAATDGLSEMILTLNTPNGTRSLSSLHGPL